MSHYNKTLMVDFQKNYTFKDKYEEESNFRIFAMS